MSNRATEPRVAVRNAGDAQQVKRAKESDRARLERERNEDIAVWSTREGRAFTRRLLADSGVYRLSMAQDANWTAFNEGGRNVGLQLLARMSVAAPEAYLRMEQEHAQLEAQEVAAPAPEESDESDTTE